MSATLYAPGLDNLRLDRIVITARAVGVPLDVIRDEAAASAKCRELSPFGQAPVLVLPTGHPVARTHAIMRALAGLADHLSLAGYSVFEEASVDQWLNWTFFELEPLAMVLTVKAVRDSLKPTDLALAEKAAASKAGPALAQLDSHLASRTFLVAQQLTIADISAAVVAGAIWDSPALSAAVKGGLPYLARWLLTCRNQPVFLAGAGAKAAAPAHAAAAPSASSAAPAPASSSSGAAAMPAGPGVSSTTGHGLPTSLTAVHTSLPSEKFVRARQRISDVLHAGEALIGSSVTVCGWARTIREADKGALQFIALNDGSVFESIQVVAERAKTEGFECIAKAGGTGSSFRIVGTVVRSPAKGQAIELAATSVTLLGEVQDSKEYPLAKKKHTLEYLRDLLHLRPRTNTVGAVARIRNACAYATHTFFQERGFLYVHTPIVTAADCEGAGEMFQVTTLLPEDPKKDVPRQKDGSIDYKKDFFGKPAMLTVSGQLQVESFAVSMSDVYTFGPTFRAEDSHTSRHLAEFWMIEPEISFATLAEDMALAEDYLKYCTRYVLDHCASDLKFFEDTFEKGLRSRLENVVNEPFKVLTYTEAIELLTSPEHAAKGAFEVKPYWGLDLGSEHERYITEQVFKKPVILINYPKDIKAFYMKLNPDGKTVAAMDVLVPKVGEIIGGSQREDDLGRLRARMAEMGVEEPPLKWYLDLRKYGSVPHAGFGLGFERLVMYVTGLENIRDAIPFPRWPGNASG